MATYQEQIESYIGSYPDTNALSQFLTQGARRVVDLIPQPELRRFCILVSIPEGGASIGNLRLVGVNGDGFPARPVPHEEYGQFLDSESLFYAVARDPVFFTTNTSIFVRPSSAGNEMLIVPYPVVSSGDTDILSGITEFDEFLVLYAAIQCRIKQIETARETLPTTPVFPDLTLEYQYLHNAIQVDEDIELAAGHIQDIQTHLAEYSAKLAVYQADISKAIQLISFYNVSLSSLQRQYNDALQLRFGTKGAPDETK